VTLAIIDDIWKEHLREMDELKQSVQNAVYEQKDPLLIYKFESFNLFKKLIDKINKDIVSFLMKADLPHKTTATEAKGQSNLADLETSRPEEIANNQNETGNNQQKKIQPIRVEHKTERNAPCPCGSGKKYKKCHGR
jgi:preprotein translocase subunit SecA